MFLGGQRDMKRWACVYSRVVQICGEIPCLFYEFLATPQGACSAQRKMQNMDGEKIDWRPFFRTTMTHVINFFASFPVVKQEHVEGNTGCIGFPHLFSWVFSRFFSPSSKSFFLIGKRTYVMTDLILYLQFSCHFTAKSLLISVHQICNQKNHQSTIKQHLVICLVQFQMNLKWWDGGANSKNLRSVPCSRAGKSQAPMNVSKQIWICIKSRLICIEDLCLYGAPWYRTNSCWIEICRTKIMTTNLSDRT